MTKILESINAFIWGVPTLILILGVGVALSVRSGLAQLSLFPKAFHCFVDQFKGRTEATSAVSPYRALCTALAATVGTGNLAGVAGAIAIGGPGAVFWMWVCAFVGMIIKFSEATLAVRYRQRNANGEWVSGPMYMICKGMGQKWNWLAVVYCFFGIVAAFGVGNATQVNAVIGGFNSVLNAFGFTQCHASNVLMGIGIAVLITLILLGGARRIGSIAEQLVPFVSLVYLFLGIGVLFLRHNEIPRALSAIIKGAFDPGAVTGGVIGSVFLALRVGTSRGIFTNEAGMGTAAIAHGAAEVRHPVEQGLMGIIEVFIDTIVICTLTALVILCSGVDIPYGMDVGIALTADAFAVVYGQWVRVLIALSLCCFAIATILGWGLYGARCAQFLFGDRVWTPFVFLQAVTVIIGAILKTGTVWLLAEIVNGLMAIPNLLALASLMPELIHLMKEYKSGNAIATGGTYENFNQCKPLRTVTYAQIPSYGGKGRKRRQTDLPFKHRSA